MRLRPVVLAAGETGDAREGGRAGDGRLHIGRRIRGLLIVPKPEGVGSLQPWREVIAKFQVRGDLLGMDGIAKPHHVGLDALFVERGKRARGGGGNLAIRHIGQRLRVADLDIRAEQP